jgi:hypothetical protein
MQRIIRRVVLSSLVVECAVTPASMESPLRSAAAARRPEALDGKARSGGRQSRRGGRRA